MWSIFHILIYYLHTLFCGVSVKIFDSVFSWVVCLLVEFFIYFWITVLFQVDLLQISSLSLACLILLMETFKEQKFLSLMKSSLPVLFMDHAFCVVFKKPLPNTRWSRFSPVLSPRSFYGFAAYIKSVTHFQLILVKGVRSVSRYIFLHVFV